MPDDADRYGHHRARWRYRLRMKAPGTRSHRKRPHVAYVVLSHRLTDQVTRLCEAIHRSSPLASVLVHHDARRVAPPVSLGSWMHVNVHRQSADWGSWDLAAETLRALDLARRVTHADLLVLISGQDYPTRHLPTWEREFWLAGGGWQGEARTLTYRPRWGRASGIGDDDLTRYVYLWWPVPRSHVLLRSGSSVAGFVRRNLFRIGHWAEPIIDVRVVSRGRGLHLGVRNPFPPFRGQLKCVKGAQWLAVDSTMFDFVRRTHCSSPWLRWCYKHSIIPDESYIQSILASRRAPLGPPLTYFEWSTTDDHPVTLTTEAIQEIRSSGSPFCRKVAPGVSDALMDALDRQITTSTT